VTVCGWLRCAFYGSFCLVWFAVVLFVAVGSSRLVYGCYRGLPGRFCSFRSRLVGYVAFVRSRSWIAPLHSVWCPGYSFLLPFFVLFGLPLPLRFFGLFFGLFVFVAFCVWRLVSHVCVCSVLFVPSLLWFGVGFRTLLVWFVDLLPLFPLPGPFANSFSTVGLVWRCRLVDVYAFAFTFLRVTYFLLLRLYLLRPHIFWWFTFGFTLVTLVLFFTRLVYWFRYVWFGLVVTFRCWFSHCGAVTFTFALPLVAGLVITVLVRYVPACSFWFFLVFHLFHVFTFCRLRLCPTVFAVVDWLVCVCVCTFTVRRGLPLCCVTFTIFVCVLRLVALPLPVLRPAYYCVVRSGLPLHYLYVRVCSALVRLVRVWFGLRFSLRCYVGSTLFTVPFVICCAKTLFYPVPARCLRLRSFVTLFRSFILRCCLLRVRLFVSCPIGSTLVALPVWCCSLLALLRCVAFGLSSVWFTFCAVRALVLPVLPVISVSFRIRLVVRSLPDFRFAVRWFGLRLR